MDLLPEDNSRYSTQAYWDERFTQEEQNDSLMDYDEFKHLFAPISKDAKILHLGCGNSLLGAQIYVDGF